MTRLLLSVCCLLGLLACRPEGEEAAEISDSKRFSWMTPPGNDYTGIEFSNDLTYTEALNPYTYRNFYNGGGVGIGDFNGDGLQDIYFTGNLVSNRLYLNQGDFTFLDYTEEAGVACPDIWSSGVAIVDVNADGYQDLYVCKAGPPAGENIPGMTGVRHNELFINNGDATFREAAAEYGLDIVGLSVHAAFFDYDGDGDLDCYLLNNSTRSTTGYDLKENMRDIPDPEGGNKLLRNLLVETGTARFEEVTQQAGIYSSSVGFGLGVTVGDVNMDGLPDLFVSNDYFERDYLYYNNGDGSFREELTDHLPEISKGSMGADFADLNNDGLPELFVTEMLPANERRYKTKAAFDNWNRYQLYRDRGYHQQFSRNVLQLNRGDGNFSEVARLAGVEATDWSWGALLVDLDNDGRRDIFVANGSGKDLLDQDYINFNGNPESIRRMIFEEGKGITDVIDRIPSEALINGVFKNQGDLKFDETAAEWGLNQATFSNGAAYADLDNDGDLDLVVNNIDSRAGIYRNNSAEPSTIFHLASRQRANPDAIGAEITAYTDEGRQYAQLHPMRGFQSTVDKRIHFSGQVERVDVKWPNGALETFQPDSLGGVLILREGEGASPTVANNAGVTDDDITFESKTLRLNDGSPLLHTEDPAKDFDRDPLLFLGLNNEGPALATADLNGDGLADLYLGGAAGTPGRILLGNRDGTFSAAAPELLAEDRAGENVDAAFFDADGDGDMDLYVANGSNQFSSASSALLDVLYYNLGNGRRWSKSPQLLPNRQQFAASSVVRPHDVDRDGDLDLFVGGRLLPGVYGVPADSYLLLNDGKGNFTSLTEKALNALGMVTDAVWLNVDADPQLELAVAAEWAPLRYLNFSTDGKVEEIVAIPATAGLWLSLTKADFDGDGREDIAAGNHGLNSRLRAATDRPLELYVNDFDGNGKAEQIMTAYAEDGKSYPLVLRDDLVKQLPGLRKNMSAYADYQGRTLDSIFAPAVLQRSVVNRAEELRILVVLNTADGPEVVGLPTEAQFAPVYAILASDLDADGDADLILAGNQSVGRPEMGIYAAGFGCILMNRGDGTFINLDPGRSNLYLKGDIRAIVPFTTGPAPSEFIVARSGGALSLLSSKKK